MSQTLLPGNQAEAMTQEHSDVFSHEVFDDHFLTERSGVTVTLDNIIEGADAEYIWTAYVRGYSPLNEKTLTRQNLGKEDYLEELADPSIIKYVARNQEGTPLGFMAVEKGLFREASPYWDPQDDELFDAIQLEADSNPDAPSFYISTMLVDELAEEYMLKTSKIILEGALLHFQEVCQTLGTNSLCFFDFAPKNGLFPRYIMESSEPSEGYTGAPVEIDTVYTNDWYKIPISEFTVEGLRAMADKITPESFGDSSIPAISAELPLYVQPEFLDGEVDDYAHATDLVSVTVMTDSQLEAFLAQSHDQLAGKQYVLANIKRITDIAANEAHRAEHYVEGVRDPLEIGERIAYQNFAAMKLVTDPRSR